MGLPAWVYGEDRKDSLIEWEDRGPYLYNRKTGQKVPKPAAGGVTNLTKPGDLPPEELQRRLDAWERETRERQARGETEEESGPGGSLGPMTAEAGIARTAGIDLHDWKDRAASHFAERMVAANRGSDPDSVENRTQEVTLPHWIDKLLLEHGQKDAYGRHRGGPSWLPREVVPYRYTEEGSERRKPSEGDLAPPGRPQGWGETYDPRWRGPDNAIRGDAPEEVNRGIDESAEWSELRSEREGDPEEGYEATQSPLVLRVRHPNGTVTYVHALTGQQLFDLGEYGLNDPQADDFKGPDPFWREGRRDW